jgi:CarD family transcriptional regulator
MSFQIGDKVIHWSFGLSEVVDIEEKIIEGHQTNCYVVRAADMMIWIPINELQQRGLRSPTPPDEFNQLFEILSSPGEKLTDDRMQRRNQLMTQLRDGQLASICRVVRDLTAFKRTTKLNDQEKSILEQAVQSLLAEWSYSLGTPVNQAQQAMTALLGENTA